MNGGDRFDELWARFTRVVMFFVGLAIMGYETVGSSGDRPWLYAAAIGLMGVPLARQAETLLGKWTGQGPADPPPAPADRPPARAPRKRRKGSTT